MVNKGEVNDLRQRRVYSLRLFLAAGHVKVRVSIRPQRAAAAFDIMARDKPRPSIRVISPFDPRGTPVPSRRCQQRLTCQKYTTRGSAGAAGTTRWLPGALGLGRTLYHVAVRLLNPASKPTIVSVSIPLCLFSLASAINQKALKQPFKQTHARKRRSVHDAAAARKQPRSITTVHAPSELGRYAQGLLYLDFVREPPMGFSDASSRAIRGNLFSRRPSPRSAGRSP